MALVEIGGQNYFFGWENGFLRKKPPYDVSQRGHPKNQLLKTSVFLLHHDGTFRGQLFFLKKVR
jgi:hypothetical protein